MAWQYMLNKKADLLVKTIYPAFHNRDFTTEEAATLMKSTVRNYGATMGSLRSRKVIELSNGEKRCHHPTGGKGEKTLWRFTPRFKAYYETRMVEKRDLP